MQRISILCVLLALPLCAVAQTEGTIGAGTILSHNMGQEGPLRTVAFKGLVALGTFDITGAVELTESRKLQTSGGYQVSLEGGARKRFGLAFLASQLRYSHTNATEWTKDVGFLQLQAGFRIEYRDPNRTRANRDEFSISFRREIATDALDPNRTWGWRLLWQHDHPLYRSLFIRFSALLAWYHFFQKNWVDGWMAGTVSELTVALVIRP